MTFSTARREGQLTPELPTDAVRLDDAPYRLLLAFGEEQPETFARRLADVTPDDLVIFLLGVDESVPGQYLISSGVFETHLWRVVRHIWTTGLLDFATPAGDTLADRTFLWLALLGSINRAGFALGHSRELSVVARDLGNRSLRFQEGVAGRLMARLPDEDLRENGAVYQLVELAKAQFHARRHDEMWNTIMRAWHLRALAGSTGEAAAEARATIATHAASAAAWRPRHIAADLDTCLEMLRVSREELEGLPGATRTSALVRVALAEENLWRSAYSNRVVGGLASAEKRLDICEPLVLRLHDTLDGFDLDTGEFPQLATDELEALVKLVRLVGEQHLWLGNTGASGRYSLALRHLETRPIAFWDSRFSSVGAHTPLGEMTLIAEEFVRRRHELDGVVNPHQKRRIYRRAASFVSLLARSLDQSKFHSAATYWRYKRLQLNESAAGADAELVTLIAEFAADHRQDEEIPSAVAEPAIWATAQEPDAEDLSGATAPGEADRSVIVHTNRAGQVPRRKRVRTRRNKLTTPMAPMPLGTEFDSSARRVLDAITSENPLALAMSVRKLIASIPPYIAEDARDRVKEILDAVDDWRPANRVDVPKPHLGDLQDGRLVNDYLLLSALEFTERYVPYLAPEISLQLARRVHLDSHDRILHAQRSYRDGMAADRVNQALSALLHLIRVGLEAGDTESIHNGTDIFVSTVHGAALRSNGAASLVDFAEWIARRVRQVVGPLMDAGYAEVALRLLRSSTDWLGTVLARDPGLLEEFQLVELIARERSVESAKQLWSLIDDRIMSTAPGTLSNVTEPVSAPAPEPGEAIVDIVLAAGRVQAIVQTLEGSATRTTSADLGITGIEFAQLSEAIWFELRPSRRGSPCPTLRVLHQRIAAPILSLCGDADRLLVVQHGEMANVPLHAAEGPDGYLIEHARVSYQSTFDRSPRDMPTGPRDLVCGWDAAIDAGLESEDTSAALRAHGRLVDSPGSADEGYRLLLNNDAVRAPLLHVAAHGVTNPWPESLRSTIQLSPTHGISAGQWLREGRRAAFVFFNVCGLGRVQPHAGDVNGFPLALRIRGADAVLAAISYIPPAQSRLFARDFYGAFGVADSLGAYQAASKTAIERQEHPSGWAPYVHYGRGYSL